MIHFVLIDFILFLCLHLFKREHMWTKRLQQCSSTLVYLTVIFMQINPVSWMHLLTKLVFPCKWENALCPQGFVKRSACWCQEKEREGRRKGERVREREIKFISLAYLHPIGQFGAWQGLFCLFPGLHRQSRPCPLGRTWILSPASLSCSWLCPQNLRNSLLY